MLEGKKKLEIAYIILKKNKDYQSYFERASRFILKILQFKYFNRAERQKLKKFDRK